jgi:hypothetical protein
MKFVKKWFKWFFFILIVIISFLIAGLYSYRYISTKDISEEPDNLSIKIFKHKNVIFKYGQKGDYPFLNKSYDGKNWEQIKMGNFWINMYPDGFNYYSMSSVQNTIWIACFHSCSKSDCETYIYDYFYSKDNGESWESLNNKIGYNCYALSFKNDNEATCYYELNNRVVYLTTKDRGETWQENILK